MKTIAKIEQYCRENIEDYELRVQLAVGRMDRWRAPLDSVDPSLCSEIEDYMTEYCEENGIDCEDFTAEDVIFHC